MSKRPTVVVTRRLPEPVEKELSREFDARLNRDDRPLGSEGLQEALGTADALLCTVTDRLTADVLSAELASAVGQLRIEHDPKCVHEIRLADPVLANDNRIRRKGVDEKVPEIAKVLDIDSANTHVTPRRVMCGLRRKAAQDNRG